MRAAFLKLRDLLDARERRDAALLFLVMLVVGFLEMIGVASVMPFISVASDPEIIFRNEHLKWLFDLFGFTEANDFLVFLGIIVFIVVVGSLAFRATGIGGRRSHAGAGA